MGSVIFLSERRAAPALEQDVPPAVAHIREALDRYRRDLRLMLGQEDPSPVNVDDVVILERFRASRARWKFIGDRLLRIKTLEAMLDLVLEVSEVHV